jgi:hypothetical protein
MCFLKLNIGNKYGLCSELKKCPGIVHITNLPLTTRYVLGVFNPSQNVKGLHQCENRGRLRDNAV